MQERMLAHPHYHKTILSISLVVSFGFLALLGLPLSMMMNEHGQMSNCPFQSQTEVICPMQAGEHIAKWRHAITGIPREVLGLALAVLIVLACWRFIPRFSREGGATIDIVLQRLRHERGLSSTFNFLQFAFSQGILHPKIYG